MKAIFLLLMVVSLRSFAQVGVTADVTLNPMGSFKAKTSDVKGTAVVNGDSVTAENIVVNLKNLETGIGLRDNHARKKYLEVEKYPDAVLVKGSGKGGKGTGTLRLHGVEHEISGDFKVNGDSLTATFPVKLSDFKIEAINYKGIGVEDTVNVSVTVPVKKGEPAPKKEDGSAKKGEAPAKSIAPAKPAPPAPVKI